MRMRHLIATGVSITLLAGALPALAGPVYVPFAADTVVDGLHYETQVWATNRGAGTTRRFSAHFIPAGTDGTDRGGAGPRQVDVPANTTILVRNLAPTSTTGLLEVTGAPQVVISSHLVPTGNNLGRTGVQLPMISDQNTLAANTSSLIQGFARGNQLKSDFVLINLATAAARCTASVAAAGGNAIGAPATLSLPPLSIQRYTDVLGLLGQQALSGARLTLNCNQPHFAFGLTFDASHAAVSVLLPATAVAAAAPPPPPPPSCPEGAICFDRLATPYVPTPAESIRRETFELDAGEYRKVRMVVTVCTTTEVAEPVSGLHSFFWLAINRHFRLLGFAAFRGVGEILFRHGIDIPAPDKPRIVEGFNFVPGNDYTADFVYDAANRRVELKVLDEDGNLLLRIEDDRQIGRIQLNSSEDLVADFSFELGENENEPPSFGWGYKDLHLEVFP